MTSLVGLAGCGENSGSGSSGDSGSSETSSGSNEFVAPMYMNPEVISFFPGWGGPQYVDTELQKNKMASVNQAMYESGLFANWHENRPKLFTPSEVETKLLTPEVVTGGDVQTDRADKAAQYTVAPDAMWSDGTEVTAKDFVLDQIFQRASQGVPYDSWKDNQQGNPRSNWEEILFPDGPDGKVVQFTDPWGVIDSLGENAFFLGNMLRGCSATAQGTDGCVPAHLSPLDEAFEVGMEAVRNAVENPSEWYENREALKNEVDFTHEVIAKSRDPDWLATNGAYTLSEIRGAQEVVLEPNPEWRGEEPAFDTLRFVYNESQDRRTSSLISGELDYLDDTLPAETWSSVPDKYENATFGVGDAGGIGMDHSDPHLGNRNVRAAMFRALNVEPIASSIHPELANGVTAPGIDTPGILSLDVISEDWLNDNLIDYSHDPEGAAQMMRDEGYSRDGDVWVGPDGERLEYELPTPQSAQESGSLSMVQGVAQQWSNFGIPVSIRTMDTTTWQQQFKNGEFKMWPGGAVPFGGWYMGNWWTTAFEIYKLHTDYKMRAWGMHPQEQIESHLPWETGGSRTSDNSLLKDLTVEIPPIGQPDGPRSDYRIYYEHGIRRLGETPEEFGADEEYWKQRFWSYNWQLPWIPIYRNENQVWWNDAEHDFSQAKDHFMWDYLGESWQMHDLLANNFIDTM